MQFFLPGVFRSTHNGLAIILYVGLEDGHKRWHWHNAQPILHNQMHAKMIMRKRMRTRTHKPFFLAWDTRACISRQNRHLRRPANGSIFIRYLHENMNNPGAWPQIYARKSWAMALAGSSMIKPCAPSAQPQQHRVSWLLFALCVKMQAAQICSLFRAIHFFEIYKAIVTLVRVHAGEVSAGSPQQRYKQLMLMRSNTLSKHDAKVTKRSASASDLTALEEKDVRHEKLQFSQHRKSIVIIIAPPPRPCQHARPTIAVNKTITHTRLRLKPKMMTRTSPIGWTTMSWGSTKMARSWKIWGNTKRWVWGADILLLRRHYLYFAFACLRMWWSCPRRRRRRRRRRKWVPRGMHLIVRRACVALFMYFVGWAVKWLRDAEGTFPCLDITFVHVYLYIFIACAYVCMYLCACVYVRMCMYVCMHACMYVCMYV